MTRAPAATVTQNERGVVTAVTEVAGRRLTLQHGKFAPLADCAVMATYGDTSMLVTAVSPMLIEGPPDGLPLTVDYREMWFASGIIPGSFNRKEKWVPALCPWFPSCLRTLGKCAPQVARGMSSVHGPVGGRGPHCRVPFRALQYE